MMFTDLNFDYLLKDVNLCKIRDFEKRREKNGLFSIEASMRVIYMYLLNNLYIRLIVPGLIHSNIT